MFVVILALFLGELKVNNGVIIVFSIQQVQNVELRIFLCHQMTQSLFIRKKEKNYMNYSKEMRFKNEVRLL